MAFTLFGEEGDQQDVRRIFEKGCHTIAIDLGSQLRVVLGAAVVLVEEPEVEIGSADATDSVGCDGQASRSGSFAPPFAEREIDGELACAGQRREEAVDFTAVSQVATLGEPGWKLVIPADALEIGVES